MELTVAEQLERLEQHFLHAFLGFSIQYLRSYDDAEELAQEIVLRALTVIREERVKENFDAYLWSIAHNTAKNFLRTAATRRTLPEESMAGLPVMEESPEDAVLSAEDKERVRRSLARLWSSYREVLVCRYYDELSVADTAARLGLSPPMVKFYLRVGKEKLKEDFLMSDVNKSLRPLPFSVYASSIDLMRVNVWQVFSRKLPCQLAIICHDKPCTITEISRETGVPAVYLEEEIALLLDAGLIVQVGKDKYRTNLHILHADTAARLRAEIRTLYESYLPAVLAAFERFLPRMRECGIFDHDVPDERYHWFFAQQVRSWGELWAYRYPCILSCGARGFVYADESDSPRWAGGQTPTRLAECTVWPVDVIAFGEYHRQRELRGEKKAALLWDIYCGRADEPDDLLCAELIEEGYVVRENGALRCNVMVETVAARSLFREINAALAPEINRLSQKTSTALRALMKDTIPEQLREYADGFAAMWIHFYSGALFNEALADAGFLVIPTDNTPVACYIVEK